jgi:hypothetical protein
MYSLTRQLNVLIGIQACSPTCTSQNSASHAFCQVRRLPTWQGSCGSRFYHSCMFHIHDNTEGSFMRTPPAIIKSLSHHVPTGDGESLSSAWQKRAVSSICCGIFSKSRICKQTTVNHMTAAGSSVKLGTSLQSRGHGRALRCNGHVHSGTY